MKGRIIKAGEVLPTSLTAFNPDDALKSLEQKVQEASAGIDRDRKQAEEEAKKYFEKAIQEGYKQGYEQGARKAREEEQASFAKKLQQEVGERTGSLQEAMTAVVQTLREAPASWVTQWERTTLELICSIAERVVRKVVDHDNEVAGRTLREILDLVARAPQINIFLNPADFETLQMSPRLWRDIVGPRAEIDFHPDPAITRGGCRCETAQCTIDATIETQIERLCAEILGRDPKATC